MTIKLNIQQRNLICWLKLGKSTLHSPQKKFMKIGIMKQIIGISATVHGLGEFQWHSLSCLY